jgi:DNA-directed RNA polymerase subunit RPC12/RpoP
VDLCVNATEKDTEIRCKCRHRIALLPGRSSGDFLVKAENFLTN